MFRAHRHQRHGRQRARDAGDFRGPPAGAHAGSADRIRTQVAATAGLCSRPSGCAGGRIVKSLVFTLKSLHSAFLNCHTRTPRRREAAEESGLDVLGFQGSQVRRFSVNKSAYSGREEPENPGTSEPENLPDAFFSILLSTQTRANHAAPESIRRAGFRRGGRSRSDRTCQRRQPRGARNADPAASGVDLQHRPPHGLHPAGRRGGHPGSADQAADHPARRSRARASSAPGSTASSSTTC